MRDEKEYNSRVMWRCGVPLPKGIRGGIIRLSSGASASVVVGRCEEGKWEHVSIALYKKRLPTWAEMCEVKNIFWDDEEEVVQIHPKKSQYVNIVEALHLWRPVDGDWTKLNDM